MKGFAAALFVMTIALTLAAVLGPLRRSRRSLQAMVVAASAVGGRLLPTAGPWYRRSRAVLDADIDGIPIRFSFAATTNEGRTSLCSRATTLSGVRLSLESGRRTRIARVAALLGLNVSTTGDAAYDEIFAVRADDRTSARRVLSPLVRKLHLACADARLEIAPGRVLVERPGDTVAPATISLMMRLCAALAAAARTSSA